MRSTSHADPNQRSNSGAIGDARRQVGSSTRLPQPLTSFLGRERELEDIKTTLGDPRTRLLTLTGPGGVGKTRLALEVAKEGYDNDQAVFVSLASVRDASLVAATIGGAFELTDQGNSPLAERLASHIGDTPVLLVLDNFEHLIDAAPIVAGLLMSCHTLTILATSRRDLRISGERVYLVLPLETPGAASADEVEQSAAGRLFVERSRPFVNNPGGPIWDHAEILAIAEICNRLDGLPLAIELAAARTRVLPPSELLARLDSQLPLLTDGPVDAPDRQRTMRDAIDWSYDLLSKDERRLLRTLSVFSGGFTLDAAETVCAHDQSTLVVDVLTRLIDHSLIQRSTAKSGAPRFTMLETIREFALEMLISQGEEAEARERHVSWLLELIDPPHPERWNDLRGHGDGHLDAELDNLRAAFAWSLQQSDAIQAAQITWGMLPIWWRHGLNGEGAETIREVVARSETLDPRMLVGLLCRLAEFAHTRGNDVGCLDVATRALEITGRFEQFEGTHAALFSMGLCSRLGDPSSSIAWMSQAIEMSRDNQDDRRRAMGLVGRALALISLGDAQRALADVTAALPLIEQYADEDEMRHDHALALVAAAWASDLLDHIDQAEDYANCALALSREFAIHTGLWGSHRQLIGIALRRGDLTTAAHHAREWLTSSQRGGSLSYGTFGFALTAMLAQVTRNWEQAARFAGYAEALWIRAQYPEASWRNAAIGDYDIEPTRRSLGESEFAAQFQVGRQFTDAEAYNEAATFLRDVQKLVATSSLLTRRESDVLSLLAQGKTNQEIATELFLGKSTVDTHVSHILAKLDVDSRRVAVQVARARGLLNG